MRKFLLLLVSAFMLVGCGTSSVPSGENPGPTAETAKTELKLSNYYASLSNEKSIVPYYNVNQDAKFVFHFNTNEIEPSLAVTVHTDPKCETNSLVYQVNDCYRTENGYDIVVKPGSPVLNSSDRAEGKLENYNWGNAPIYYLSVNYDMNSKEAKKLDEPIIIPFTVKREISTPNVEQQVNDNGLYTLTWKSVDNAVSYNIYSAFRVRTESKARDLTRAEAGYSGDHLTKIATVSDTSFNDWDNAYQESNGYVFDENGFGLDTYYVTAVDANGNESSFSLGMTAWTIADRLPSRNDNLFEKGDSGFVEVLPETISVTMKDGSKREYPVSYTKTEVLDKVCAYYDYAIDGTMLTGHLEYFNESNEYPDKVESSYQLKPGAYNIEQIPNIIPENTFNYEGMDNNSNGKIELFTEGTYSDDSKLVVDPESLLKRADEENARMVMDGVYTNENGPTPLVYKEVKSSEVTQSEPQQDVQETPKSDDSSIIEKKPEADNSAKPVENTPNVEEQSKPAENTPAKPADNAPKAEQVTEPVQNQETSKPEVVQEDTQKREEVTQEPQEEKQEVVAPSDEKTEEPKTEESITEPSEEQKPEEPTEETSEPVAEPTEEPTIEPTVEPTEEPVAEEPEGSTEINVEEVTINEEFADFPIFADTEEEAYLAIQMVNQNNDFEFTQYPALTTMSTLGDVLLKIIRQNPYIIDVTGVAVNSDYTLHVDYSWSNDATRQKQQEIYNKANEVVNSIITPGMSDEEKNKAIWDYLETNSSYDYDALTIAQENNFKASALSGNTDAFNTYGILVKGVGVCQSYSLVYKLLGSMAGLDVKAVSGTVSGELPHAWNIVKINGVWTWVDATNNGKSFGIPYWIYQTSYDFAHDNGYDLNGDWELDSLLGYAYTSSMDYDYYAERGLYAATNEDLARLFEEKFTGESFTFKVGKDVTLSDESLARRVVQKIAEILSDPREALNHMFLGYGMMWFKN